MLQYHVSCGTSKKQVIIEENATIDDLRVKIASKFNMRRPDSLQVFNKDFGDWLDLEEEDELPPTMSRVKVLDDPNEDTEDKASSDIHEDREVPSRQTSVASTCPQTLTSEGARSSFFVNFKVPEMPHDVQKLLNDNNKAVLERKWRRKIVSHLYDNMVQVAVYPHSWEYNAVCSALINKHPILKDRTINGSGYDTIKESLRTKFKHERGIRTPSTDVARRRELYGRNGPRKRAEDNVEKAPSPVKRKKRDSIETSHGGEDEASIQRHIASLKDLASKRGADPSIIQDKMKRTRSHRLCFIQANALQDVLNEYPILRFEKQLIRELQNTYGAKEIAAAIAESVTASGEVILREGLKVPAAQEVIEQYQDKVDGATTDKQKKDLLVALSCLLFPLIFGEKDSMYTINKEPQSPTPTLVISGNPFECRDLAIFMDGIEVCRASDLTSGFVATFSSFYVFGVQYPQRGKRTLQLYQKFFAGLDDGSPLPPRVQRFLNSLV
ncbi:uncharacterized protein LOC129258791 isoform X1 [Lytechinus pictus]|uniref:uncharacterized protein LOC129267283 isoform X2 n=1 Tax=Lytechinus pictus TaxID=7653 RepID=UPI0030B9D9D2